MLGGYSCPRVFPSIPLCISLPIPHSRGQVHTRSLPFLASSKNPNEKLQTYKKFMFVRNPFERVLSAFRDKLERKDELYNFQTAVGKKIEQKYR